MAIKSEHPFGDAQRDLIGCARTFDRNSRLQLQGDATIKFKMRKFVLERYRCKRVRSSRLCLLTCKQGGCVPTRLSKLRPFTAAATPRHPPTGTCLRAIR
jgi:hypothetical protein